MTRPVPFLGPYRSASTYIRYVCDRVPVVPSVAAYPRGSRERLLPCNDKLACAALRVLRTFGMTIVLDCELGSMVHATDTITSEGAPVQRSMLDPCLRLAKPPAPPLTTFIGRGSELEAALHLVRDPSVRLVTLTGAGGIGKTRLALEIATRSRADFDGQVAWVSLAPVQAPELVLPAIAAAVDVQEAGNEDVLERLTETLATERLLLVLDNVEHVLGAAADISALLRGCPGITALATSRAPLRISGERILVVPPLPLPVGLAGPKSGALDENESVRLFVDRARLVSPSFDLGPETALLVANICQRLDGLPLAIELAAARVYHLSVRTMNERLAHRLPLLTGGAADLPERQQTLERSVWWSYDLLAPAEQWIFRRLAVFSGGFDIDAVEAMSEDPGAALDQLTRLVDESLVQFRDDTAAGPRYSMLETIHEFARERLRQSGEDAAVRARHATFYLKMAQHAEAELATGDGIGGLPGWRRNGTISGRRSTGWRRGGSGRTISRSRPRWGSSGIPRDICPRGGRTWSARCSKPPEVTFPNTIALVPPPGWRSCWCARVHTQRPDRGSIRHCGCGRTNASRGSLPSPSACWAEWPNTVETMLRLRHFTRAGWRSIARRANRPERPPC